MTWHAQYGRPDRMPLSWLHGGPGSGSSLRHLRQVELSRYRVVLAPASHEQCARTARLTGWGHGDD
jgi:hypothetical protein